MIKAWKLREPDGGIGFVRAKTRGRARMLWPGYSGDYEEVIGLSVIRVPELDGPGPERELETVSVRCTDASTEQEWEWCGEWGEYIDFEESCKRIWEDDDARSDR